MDATTVAAAALAVAVDESRDAAHRAALLELERKAMSNEDVRSWVAQRVFTQSVQPPGTWPPMTWQSAYERVVCSRCHLVDALREVRQALRAGDPNRIEILLDHHIGDSDEEEAE